MIDGIDLDQNRPKGVSLTAKDEECGRNYHEIF